MDIGETLYVSEREAWRAWLEANHASAADIWLVFYRQGSGQPSLPYNDAVEEALCFGWIDSIVKKHGPESRAQRFTPRRPGSPISEMNKARLRRLAAAGLVLPDVLETVRDVLEETFDIPTDIAAALQADQEVWRIFQSYPESYQRIRVGFVDAARKRPDVFQRRLDYLIKMTARGKRFGMVQ